MDSRSQREAPIAPMKPQRIWWFFVLMAALAGGIAFPFLTRSVIPLARAERRLNDIYKIRRPFPYRWKEAPATSSVMIDCQSTVDDTTEIERDIEADIRNHGNSSRSLKMRGRLQLLESQFDEAIATYRHALQLAPEDADLRLESAVAYAVRAKCQGQSLDYEYALEQMLRLWDRQPNVELAFNLAILFTEVPLPQSAVDRWQFVVENEPSPAWRQEAQSRLAEAKTLLSSWNMRLHELTDSPTSYLSHAREDRTSLEVVLASALKNWLPLYYKDSAAHAALNQLATDLWNEHGDFWLKDLLQTPATITGRKAFQVLSAAFEKNDSGEHIRAAAYAATAEWLFGQIGSSAGMWRARLEQVYSLDRQWKQVGCLRKLHGLRQAAERLNYVWIEGQARMEHISCLAQTRSAEILEECERTQKWIANTNYRGLNLRALSFLTSQYFSIDRQLRIWHEGLKGLDDFWKSPLPSNRGYTLYYAIGSSARSTGNRYTALALLREGIRTLEDSPYRQLFALALSDLGEWEWEQGLRGEALLTFARMDEIFAELDQHEIKNFRRLSEMSRAELEINDGRPAEALKRLRSLDIDFGESLTPAERRRLLPILGNAYLRMGELGEGSAYYRQAISQNRRDLKFIHDTPERENAQREIEPAWRGLTEAYLRQSQSSSALNVWEAFRGGRLTDLSLPTVKPPHGVLFFACAFLPSGLSTWLASSDGVEQRWLDAAEIRREIERFSLLTSSPDSPLGEVERASKELYAQLFEPFESEIRASGLLMIDAEGPLAGIPWAALLDGQGHALIEKLALSQAIGWAEASKHFTNGTVSVSNPLIFGNPKISANLEQRYPPLIDAEEEARWLQRRFPNSLLYEQAKATAQNLMLHLPNSTIFHFAGHGVSYGGFGALLLSPGTAKDAEVKLITASDIENLNLRKLELVVLTACSSGTGEREGVVNLDSLVRGFLQAGAFRVVATLWNVNSSQTAYLTVKFYQGIAAGERPSDALRGAMLSIRENSATKHPYYWAGFQIFGAP